MTAFLPLLNGIGSKNARQSQGDSTGSRHGRNAVGGNNDRLRRNCYRGNNHHVIGPPFYLTGSDWF